MKSRFSQFSEAVRTAHERTGVPGVAAALHADGETVFAAAGVRELGRDEPVEVETPFRIASVTKSFTATLVAEHGALDARRRALLSHTAGYRPEAAMELPEQCRGLWSYSNAGYWEAAESLAVDFSASLAERVLHPLGLSSTGFEEPAAPARGHVQEGETGHRAVVADSYAVERRPSGGLWSTVRDLVGYGLAHCRGWDELHAPQRDALGAEYALGWWVRDGVLDHEGSVAGYQSLLLLVPAEELVLAVLTNSWRGSGLVRRVVDELELVPPSTASENEFADGDYALGEISATVGGGWLTERETDPVTGAPVERRYRPSLDATLMSHRIDFPRPGVARIGWAAMPRVG
jgi:CubicO group peptidase (beta-lactamase class C family)